MKMTVSTMTVENMIVNICDNESNELGQMIPSGDYYITVEDTSDPEYALSVGLNDTSVVLFRYTQGADDQLWAMQGDGSANTRFRISNVEADSFLSYNQDGEVVLIGANDTPWNMLMDSMDGNEYIVYIRPVSDPTMFIGVDTIESEAPCKLYPMDEALKFRLRRMA